MNNLSLFCRARLFVVDLFIGCLARVAFNLEPMANEKTLDNAR
jgi:hypothetical protein